MWADLPPALHERVVCSIVAAANYQIPTNLVLAVAEQEGGKPGQWVRNSNGTHDVGAMQFNTSYLTSELARYGITAADVASEGCYAYELAAWRLQGHIRNDRGDLWTRAANYHSRTPVHNGLYRARLMQRAARWGNWLQTHFPASKMATTSPPAAKLAPEPVPTAGLRPVAPRLNGPETAGVLETPQRSASGPGFPGFTARMITGPVQ